MKVKLFIMSIVLSLFLPVASSYAKDMPFTQEDRDRLIRLEVKVDQMEKRFDQRFEQIDKRLERLESVMTWGFGLLFTSMIGLVGFVLWDRRAALAPAIRKNKELKELEEREEKLERALKEIALKDPNVYEALKHVGIL
ncbi:MAG: hypothetical protein HZB80_01755 [Deltaproteobacteria bacterium]|nr:hypothetical protein [Deltaproteobacteria bacterium]